MKKVLILLLMMSNLCFGQNSYPDNGTAILNSGTDQALILKDGRNGINWNYIEWQLSDGTRDWTLGRRGTTGYFTLWRNGTNDVFTADNNGKIGIGTTNPAGNLHVIGRPDFDGSTKVLITNGASDHGRTNLILTGRINGSNDAWAFGSSARNTIVFSSNSASTGNNIGNTGTEKFSIQHEQNSHSLGFLSQGNGNSPVLVMTQSGKVGIGTTDPHEKLAIEGNVSMLLQTSLGYLPSQDKFVHNGNNVGNYSLGWYNDSWLTGAPSGYLSAFGGLKVFTGGQPRLVVTNPGKVGIGTTNPDATLTVNGDIHTKEVRVDMDVPGPDYVFEKDYNLLSLAELEAYVKANKHLPEVPSAKEMEADGLNLKEMNLILLKKVEELTLHLIEANKRIEETNEKVRALEEQLKDK